MFSSNTTQESGGYQISRSLRFNSADSAYLERTPASSGNRRTWTWSGWVKKTVVGDGRFPALLGAQSGTRDVLRFNGESLNVFFNNTSSANLVTTPVYRDVSAWYHVVLAVDTTQATDTNRVKIYVNGVQVTAFSTASYPAQNYDTFVNMNAVQRIGSDANLSDGYLNGYMTEVNFIDGQALTPSSFGEYNADTGVWQPKRYGGTYGTNGFYLNFSDNSNTTAATLGKDYSPNGNNWTPNNFSVSAGTGNDSLVDVPTNWGVDTGVGGQVRGNYCTWNPLDRDISTVATTYANGNLDCGVRDIRAIFATIAVTSGKWYWEVVPTGNTGSVNYMIGVADANTPVSTRSITGANGWAYFQNGNKFNNNTGSSYGSSYTTNDVIGVALDMDAGTVTFYKNNVSQGVAFSTLSGKAIQPMVSDGSSVHVMNYTANFGQRPFAYTAPSGFKALNTQNLPTPTIGATPATQAGKFFNPVIWTGNDVSNRTFTGVGFQPDFVWMKTRNLGFNHLLYDVIRGPSNGSVSAALSSNNTSAQGSVNDNASFGYLSGFASDGFSVVKGTATATYTNSSGHTYVAWNWKANGAGVTNTAGSITSTVSANTTSGFSVVTYTGTGANATVGHGLGAAPKMVITKKRSSTSDWAVWHTNIANTEYLLLNSAAAKATGATYWNSTTPTSTVFSVGTADPTNISTATYVAYVFSEVPGYSKFGSYTGNGSADGPFVFCGFRPAYVMVKGSNSVNTWFVLDKSRSAYNVSNAVLMLNNADSELTNNRLVDILSNGFKPRVGTDTNLNSSGEIYIFMAFAEAPFKYALAR